MKRLRAPKAKPGELLMRWGKLPRDCPDIIFAWGEGCSKRDGALLHSIIASDRPDPFNERPFSNMQPSLLRMLQDRGYDLTTFRFSIQKKQP